MSFLPSAAAGILPYWLLLTSVAGTYNAVQNYFVIWQSKEVYAGKADEMTFLAGRIFGAWTLLASLIRGMASYNIYDPLVYNLGIGTYALATFHFTTELLVFKSVKPNRASIGPLIVGWTGLIWMLTQREHYTA
ncbi:hypothetical protein I312_102306 [Cryptococcus bacillisporus CA1280]|uniref:Ergosterol biosynthetic protein 28 n=2 Tax=Cryptococcus gattii TaxID=552467 RepID=A0A0D0VTF6_CRYGA|nr:hypothetical protein I312_01739 [Cryptococcus bacillisporus CA1280]KIR67495.1 hypothetical protein I314_01911 [Cryptococcus bacillisporus CA1873]|eukprot:KIR67495.1 hypothetical protein I314_01911 [Cryptococcus gattii CA1873]